MSISRYYIEDFLQTHADRIRGRVLEIGDRRYTKKFGGDRVNHSDVLHYVDGKPNATIVADLTCADHIPSDSFDCIICTQTLQMIYDKRAALEHLHRILKPGGTLLGTTNGISKICRRRGVDDWGEYWHFTTQSIELLLSEAFSGRNVQIDSYGNVLSAIAFLHGLAAEELRKEELDYRDPDFEVIITIRATKAGANRDNS